MVPLLSSWLTIPKLYAVLTRATTIILHEIRDLGSSCRHKGTIFGKKEPYHLIGLFKATTNVGASLLSSHGKRNSAEYVADLRAKQG